MYFQKKFIVWNNLNLFNKITIADVMKLIHWIYAEGEKIQKLNFIKDRNTQIAARKCKIYIAIFSNFYILQISPKSSSICITKNK